MAAPAIAQPIPIPAAPPLETPGFWGVVLEMGFVPTPVVRVLDMAEDDKDDSDTTLGFVVEGANTEVLGVVTDAVFELSPVVRAASLRAVVADTSVLLL